MPQRTYQPNKRRALKKHGFRKRMQTLSGQKVIKARKARGRKVLTKTLSKQPLVLKGGLCKIKIC